MGHPDVRANVHSRDVSFGSTRSEHDHSELSFDPAERRRWLYCLVSPALPAHLSSYHRPENRRANARCKSTAAIAGPPLEGAHSPKQLHRSSAADQHPTLGVCPQFGRANWNCRPKPEVNNARGTARSLYSGRLSKSRSNGLKPICPLLTWRQTQELNAAVAPSAVKRQ